MIRQITLTYKADENDPGMTMNIMNAGSGVLLVSAHDFANGYDSDVRPHYFETSQEAANKFFSSAAFLIERGWNVYE